MKRYIHNMLFAAAVAAVAGLAACDVLGQKDDSTDYQFDIPAVSIAVDDNLVFNVAEECTYEPVIEWAGTRESDYDYLWTLKGHDQICKDKVLKYTFTDKGEIYITFQMTDKKTGVVYAQDFKATVSSPFTLGWLVLADDAGASRLSFVHMQTYQLYGDIYTSLYGESLGSNPCSIYNHCLSKDDQVLLVQGNGKDNVELDGGNFSKVSNIQHEFIGEKYPEENGGFSVKAACYTHRGPELLISSNGLIYDRIIKSSTTSSTVFQSDVFSTSPFVHTAGAYRIDYVPFAGASPTFQPLYDGLNRRWIAYHNVTDTGTQRAIPVFTNTSTTVFDFAKGLPSDVEMIYASTYGETTNKATLACVYKQGSSFFFNTALLTYSAPKITASAQTQKQFGDGTGISADSEFWLLRGNSSASPAVDPTLVFSVGRKIYFYHPATDRTYLLRDYSSAAGEIVKMAQRGDAQQLGVVFSDGTLRILNTTKAVFDGIRQSNIDPLNNDQVEAAVISGIPGKPVDLIFKYGKAANYQNGKIAY